MEEFRTRVSSIDTPISCHRDQLPPLTTIVEKLAIHYRQGTSVVIEHAHAHLCSYMIFHIF